VLKKERNSEGKRVKKRKDNKIRDGASRERISKNKKSKIDPARDPVEAKGGEDLEREDFGGNFVSGRG